MADAKVKISELPTGVPVNTDFIPFVSGGVTKKGLKSDLKGDTGDNATATVGTTTTGSPGTNASVTNVGTTSDAIFDFVIPRGDVGATGPTGPTGPEGPAGSGTGDVIGPASSTDNAIARYDSTTGKLIQDSGVLIDDNNNVYTNNYFANITSTVSAAGTTVLTIASSKTQRLTGASTQTFQLPVGTTLPLSSIFEFDNNSSSSLIITNNAGTTLYTVPAGGAVQSQCTGNVTTNGVWDFHAMTPASVTWGSGITGLVMNSVLSTSPSVGSGASSSTAPVFIPQRGANTTGFGGDGTNLYATIAGTARATISASGITATNLSNTNSGDDVYTYSISRTVSTGNLTVALKNYEGNDATVAKPIKVQIGGVVRTITGALSFLANAGTNWANLGSSELATKESDIFYYLAYNSTYGVVPLFGRLPTNNFIGDFSSTQTNEKGTNTGVIGFGFLNSTDPVVNIGRFNAILSAGAGYTWSIPTTSTIINSPIFTGNLVPNALPRVNKVTSITTSVTMDAFSYDLYDITAQAGSLLFNKPSISSPYNGQKIMVRIKDNGTARALTYGTGISAGAGTLPSTTTISKKTWIGLQYDVTDDKWFCLASGTEA